jgi:hypothetical protein
MATSPYSLDSDHREALETKILAELNRELVVKSIKSKLDEFCQAALDQVTDYLSGEYQLVIEEIVRDRAKRMVQSLLKGDAEIAEHFRLKAGEVKFGPDTGKPFVYDPDGVRRAIVDTFKGELMNAELIALKEENERLSKDNKRLRERSSY